MSQRFPTRSIVRGDRFAGGRGLITSTVNVQSDGQVATIAWRKRVTGRARFNNAVCLIDGYGMNGFGTNSPNSPDSHWADDRYEKAWRFSIAPMMDWTDRHCRYFHRLLAPHARLYTEMVTTGAIIHGDRARHLDFHPAEHPVALQLGGSDPSDLARCAEIAQTWGYDEINLNIGCPSERVQSGSFGACLMREPELVRDCVAAMLPVVDVPVTVKCRLGVDEMESYEGFRDFVHRVADGGCRVFLVHARKAWLQGLSPKQNREVPPLRYEWVYRLKQERPDLTIAVNGGISSLAEVEQHLQQVDGVMIGRAAYQNPWLLTAIERALVNLEWQPERDAVVAAMVEYAAAHLSSGGRLNHISRHMLGLFQGCPGAKSWRRVLSQKAHLAETGPELLREAIPSAPTAVSAPA